MCTMSGSDYRQLCRCTPPQRQNTPFRLLLVWGLLPSTEDIYTGTSNSNCFKGVEEQMNNEPNVTPAPPDVPVPRPEKVDPRPPDFPVPKPGDLPDFPVPQPEPLPPPDIPQPMF